MTVQHSLLSGMGSGESDRDHSEPLTIQEPRSWMPAGRPPSNEGDEAYLRSLMTQARIDIAAGR